VTALADPATHTTDLNDQTTHVYCCNPDTALCGLDISEMPEVPDGTGHDCIVCTDLEEQQCPDCGA
jgi:hypothetical protein